MTTTLKSIVTSVQLFDLRENTLCEWQTIKSFLLPTFGLATLFIFLQPTTTNPLNDEVPVVAASLVLTVDDGVEIVSSTAASTPLHSEDSTFIKA